MADKTVRFIIKRQPTPDTSPHWEEFDLRWRPGMNVITEASECFSDPLAASKRAADL